MPPKISPCLWFDHQAEDATRLYTAIFKDSRILAISHYPEAGQEIHGKPSGSVMTVAFELKGQYSLRSTAAPFSSSARPVLARFGFAHGARMRKA